MKQKPEAEERKDIEIVKNTSMDELLKYIDDSFKDDRSLNVLPEEPLMSNIQSGPVHLPSLNAIAAVDTPTNKCIPWTQQEHILFLIGLVRHGPGKWKEISENSVLTRTPSQIASHAQKYFKRQKIPKNERKRRSIHDITLEDLNSKLPHHIDQQNCIPIPNFAMQPPQGMQQAQNVMQFSTDPHHIEHQNWGTRNIHDTTLRYYKEVMVPRHIDHQNCITTPNFTTQTPQGVQQAQNVMQFSNDPHHIKHQNWGTRNIHDTTLRYHKEVMVPRYIDHQNWITTPNFTTQTPQGVQQAQNVMQFSNDPHHIKHQNWGTRNIHDTTLRYHKEVMVPRHIDHQNCITTPNFTTQTPQGVQQAQNVMQFSNDPHHIKHQNWGTRNIHDTGLQRHIDQQNWVARNFAMQPLQKVQQEQDVMQFNSGPHQSNGIGFLGYNLPLFHRRN